MSYYNPSQMQNCNFNARACWATLHGDLNRTWVCTPKWDDFTRVEGWVSVRERWLAIKGNSSMFVRFIDTQDPTNGHSLVCYKYQGRAWTIQAYYGQSSLTCVETDIFANEDTSLLQNLRSCAPVSAKDFGVSNDSSKRVCYHADCHYCIRDM